MLFNVRDGGPVKYLYCLIEVAIHVDREQGGNGVVEHDQYMYPILHRVARRGSVLRPTWPVGCSGLTDSSKRRPDHAAFLVNQLAQASTTSAHKVPNQLIENSVFWQEFA